MVRSLPWPSALLVWGSFVLVSIVACTQAERTLEIIDTPAIILDEVCGMALVVLANAALISSPVALLIAFLLFRVFDIVKPPPLRRLARLPGGWGIMADDLGAAAYTLAILWLMRACGVAG